MKENIKYLFNDTAFLASFILFVLWIVVAIVMYDVYFILNIFLGCAIGFSMVFGLSWVISKIKKDKQ